MPPTDELLAAEAEFRSENKHHHHSDEQQLLSENPSATVSLGLDGSTDQQHARKKLKLSEADKKRSIRMFGALMGTLSKFQDETSKTRQTEAAQRRAAVENRLQAKLKTESDALHQLRAYELEEKNIRSSVWRKTEELGHLSEFKLIHFANKLAFSNYLCTSSLSGKTANVTDITTDIRDESSISSKNINLSAERGRYQENPIYWLPNKLLPQQKELLEKQRRMAREAVEEEQQAWYTEKQTRQNELDVLISERDIRLNEIEAEKAKARLSAAAAVETQAVDEHGSLSASAAAAPQNQMRPVDTDMGRGDSPVVTNGMERDEDAVEY